MDGGVRSWMRLELQVEGLSECESIIPSSNHCSLDSGGGRVLTLSALAGMA